MIITYIKTEATDQALDNLEQFFNDNGNSLIAEQLGHHAEVRCTDESRVQ